MSINYISTPHGTINKILRRTNKMETYENATSGLFYFRHTDGEQRFIIINPATQYSMG